MTQFCRCQVCSHSPARSNNPANGQPEIVSGRLVQLGPNDTLVHWSGRRFASLTSTELARIELRGVNPLAVCASFYLYRNGAGPARCPAQLRRMGLGGEYRYAITSAIGNNISIYQKNALPARVGEAEEVVVVLGCGGTITYQGVAGTGLPGEFATAIDRQELLLAA
jgi:hypothetical protein